MGSLVLALGAGEVDEALTFAPKRRDIDRKMTSESELTLLWVTRCVTLCFGEIHVRSRSGGLSDTECTTELGRIAPRPIGPVLVQGAGQ